jgi:hypothetical protein
VEVVLLDVIVELIGVGDGLVELKLGVGFPLLFRQVQAEETRADVLGPH